MANGNGGNVRPISSDEALAEYKRKQQAAMPMRSAFADLIHFALHLVTKNEAPTIELDNTRHSIRQVYVHNGTLYIDRNDGQPMLRMFVDEANITSYERRDIFLGACSRMDHSPTPMDYPTKDVGYVTRCRNCNGLGAITDEGITVGTLHIHRCTYPMIEELLQ